MRVLHQRPNPPYADEPWIVTLACATTTCRRVATTIVYGPVDSSGVRPSFGCYCRLCAERTLRHLLRDSQPSRLRAIESSVPIPTS